MIELKNNSLSFSFPEIHPGARLEIEFQRTLRIPDDGTDYPLPAGLGAFPIEHVDDHMRSVPRDWLEHGGVMLPMYQAEAMWINFQSSYISDRETSYPFAVKIAAGKIDAVTGEGWTDRLDASPQNYVMIPEQPWLDGFCVEQGVIRQFIAMPLGEGYSAEEQITGKAEFGGLQIMVYPMKKKAFERNHPVIERTDHDLPGPSMPAYSKMMDVCYSMEPVAAQMGLGAGGRMRQQIFDDHYDFADWDLQTQSRCFVHLSNSLNWKQVTGQQPPTEPPTAETYREAGVPWFDHYRELPVVAGSKVLRGLKSVATLGKEKDQQALPDNDPVVIDKVIQLREPLVAGQVREGQF
jgi:hypothetical protein